MALSSGRLRRRIFGISASETSVSRRGFRGRDADIRQRLERIGQAFLQGYHAAIEEDEPDALVSRLGPIESEFRGFAFEGAAMGLALRDHLPPWRRDRLGAFLNGPGAAHPYMIHVGAGWAFARLPWLRHNLGRPLARLDPLLRWLAVDGYGFHEGYFSWRRSVEGQAIPRRLTGYARHAFDQGLGRSLWFVEGAKVARIASTIAVFAPARHADLWSGVGLACAYAGGVDRAAIGALRASAGVHRPRMALGAAFAAKARQRAGNPADHTDLACEVLCEMTADEAAQVTDDALEALPEDGAVVAYEVWRRRIEARWTREAVST
jgi:enediyne biosynthesis protein E3